MIGKCPSCEVEFDFPDQACTLVCPACAEVSRVEKDWRILSLIPKDVLKKAPKDFLEKVEALKRSLKQHEN